MLHTRDVSNKEKAFQSAECYKPPWFVLLLEICPNVVISRGQFCIKQLFGKRVDRDSRDVEEQIKHHDTVCMVLRA